MTDMKTNLQKGWPGTPIAALFTNVIKAFRRNVSGNREPMTSIEDEIRGARYATAAIFLNGNGLEVGAGPRPWPLPANANAIYGDIRDEASLSSYFQDSGSPAGDYIDAQTLSQIRDKSLDFLISAHVIEHLFDPIGSIREAMRCLRPGGCYLIAVPDMRHTFDHNRPETPLEHVLQDFQDGGVGTRLQAYEEHARYVHPVFQPALTEEEIAEGVKRCSEVNMDIHVHAWTFSGFETMLKACSKMFPAKIEAGFSVGNENIFAVKKSS